MLDAVVIAAAKEEGGSFLVQPDIGLMVWTLLVFAISGLLLKKYAFPQIAEALDRRQRIIEDSLDTAAQTRAEAETLLEEYRERLAAAREQAEAILARARKAAETSEQETLAQAKKRREELMAQTRRDIEAETQRAIQEIRNEVADLTILATEKITRKTLTEDDQRKLVEDTLAELDFSALAGEGSKN
jgi:F-type H+-transporting ATPase subunit b